MFQSVCANAVENWTVQKYVVSVVKIMKDIINSVVQGLVKLWARNLKTDGSRPQVLMQQTLNQVSVKRSTHKDPLLCIPFTVFS